MWIVYMKVSVGMWIHMCVCVHADKQLYMDVSCEQDHDHELICVSVDVCI